MPETIHDKPGIFVTPEGCIVDGSDISRGFVVPLARFAFVGAYVLLWPRLSRTGRSGGG